MRLALLLLLLCGVPSAFAQSLPGTGGFSGNAGLRELPPTELDKRLAEVSDTGELQPLARALSRRGQHVDSARVWRRLVDLRPHLGEYRYEMAAELATNDYKSLVYSALLHLQTQGYAFRVEDDKRFVLVSDTEVWQHIIKGFAVNRDPFGEGRIAYTLPKEDLLLESLVWDPGRRQLLVGGARSGKVYAVTEGGKLRTLVSAEGENGMWGVFDLAVDARRGVLWVASTAVPHYSGYNAETDLGAAGIFKFDLKSGKFIKRFLSPRVVGQQFFMSSLTVAPDGTLFAADGVNNAIYMVREDKLSRLVHNPVLTSIRGMAVSGDGKTLYFADYERGLFGLDIESLTPFEVSVTKTLALGGIDGLLFHDGALIIVQNGMNPRRVMRLALDSKGRMIESVKPLAANQEALSLPTLATLAGDEVMLIANSQKANYDRFGLLRDKDKLAGTVIYAVKAKPAEPSTD